METNKYQEALDRIGCYAYEHNLYEPIDTLQDLINIYKAKPVVVLQSTKNGGFVGDTIIEPDYEKALDKACKELAKLERFYLETGGIEEFSWPEEQWKKYLLRGN